MTSKTFFLDFRQLLFLSPAYLLTPNDGVFIIIFYWIDKYFMLAAPNQKTLFIIISYIMIIIDQYLYNLHLSSVKAIIIMFNNIQ